MAALARGLMTPGACPALTTLCLKSERFLQFTCNHSEAVNKIGVKGAAALARSLATPGACSALSELNLYSK